MAQQDTSYKLIPKVFTIADACRLTKTGDWPLTAGAAQNLYSSPTLPTNTIRYGTDNFTFIEVLP